MADAPEPFHTVEEAIAAGADPATTEEDLRRSQISVGEMVKEDLADPNTPSSAASFAEGGSAGFEHPAHELREGDEPG